MISAILFQFIIMITPFSDLCLKLLDNVHTSDANGLIHGVLQVLFLC